MTVGNRIKQLREKAGLSQVAYGKLFGVSGPGVALWETDKNKPAHGRLLDIAKFGGVSLSWLLTGDEEADETIGVPPNSYDYTTGASLADEAVDVNFLLECQHAVTSLCHELGVQPTRAITEVARNIYLDAVANTAGPDARMANLQAIIRIYRRHPTLLSGV